MCWEVQEVDATVPLSEGSWLNMSVNNPLDAKRQQDGILINSLNGHVTLT